MATQIAKRLTVLYSRNKNSVYNQLGLVLHRFSGRFFSTKSSTLVNPNFQASLFTPYTKAIKQNLILLFLTTKDSSVISKLKLVKRHKGSIRAVVTRKPKLSVFFSLYMLNEGIYTWVEKERAKTVTLEDSAPHLEKWRLKV